MVSELRTNLFNILLRNIPSLGMDELMATEEFLRNSLKMIESVKLMRMALEPGLPEIKMELNHKDIKMTEQQNLIVQGAEGEDLSNPLNSSNQSNQSMQSAPSQNIGQNIEQQKEIQIDLKIVKLTPEELKSMQLIPTRNINPQKLYYFTGVLEDFTANLYGECKNCLNSCSDCWILNPRKSRQSDDQNQKRPKAGVFIKCQIRFLNGAPFTAVLFNHSAAAVFNMDIASFIELVKQDGIQQIKQMALGRPIRFMGKLGNSQQKNEAITDRAEFIDWTSIVALSEAINNSIG